MFIVRHSALVFRRGRRTAGWCEGSGNQYTRYEYHTISCSLSGTPSLFANRSAPPNITPAAREAPTMLSQHGHPLPQKHRILGRSPGKDDPASVFKDGYRETPYCNWESSGTAVLSDPGSARAKGARLSGGTPQQCPVGGNATWDVGGNKTYGSAKAMVKFPQIRLPGGAFLVSARSSGRMPR